MYLLSPAGWHISPPNRNECREEKNRLCSAHKCKVYINRECQGSSGGANSPAIARMTQFPDFCSKQYVLVKIGSSKDFSCKGLLPLHMIFSFFLLPHSLDCDFCASSATLTQWEALVSWNETQSQVNHSKLGDILWLCFRYSLSSWYKLCLKTQVLWGLSAFTVEENCNSVGYG